MGGSTLTKADATLLPSKTNPVPPPLRVGLVGAGVISAQYLASFARLDDVELVAVADLDLDRAGGIAHEQGVRASTVADLMAAEDIDLVLNLTIPAAHLEVCTAALQAGKHVYVEKPLALTVADGRALLRLAESKGLRVAGAPDTVLGTGVQTARALIDSGRIGVPVAATASWSSPGHERWHPAPDFYYQQGGGPLFDMGPYYLTALVTLLGPVQRVSAMSGRSARQRTVESGPRAGSALHVSIDTHITALLEHASGAISTVVLSFEVWGSRLPRIEVFGTQGSVSVPDPNRFDGDVELLDTGREWSTVQPEAGYVESGRGYGVADFARALTSNLPHRASGEMALHVLDIMESINDAARSNAAVTLTTTTVRPAAVPLIDLASTAYSS